MNFNCNDNVDDKSLNKIEALIIDIPLLLLTIFYNKNSKAFFTLLGFVEKAKEIVTNLANRLFYHCVITIENILLNHINSANVNCDIFNNNLFAYITIN